MTVARKLFLGSIVILVFGVGWFLFERSTAPETSQTKKVSTVSTTTTTIIAFGDSLTAGYGLPVAESYPAQLEEVLRREGYDVQVINAGVSGETTRGNQERASFIRQQNPDIVLLGIGGNDALRQLPITETEKNIAATLEILKSGDSPPVVILLTMQAPLNAGSEYKRAFDAMYAKIASAYGVELAPFITPEVFFDSSKKLPDGIHLNRDGYGVVVREYLLPTMQKALSRP